MTKNPETIFKERALADLRALPKTWAEKIQQVAIHGTPDILACIGGDFVAIELKKDEKGKPSAIQQYELERITRAQGRAFVASPETWDKLLLKLRRRAVLGYWPSGAAYSPRRTKKKTPARKGRGGSGGEI